MQRRRNAELTSAVPFSVTVVSENKILLGLNPCMLSQPGVTTDEIDRAVHKMTIEAGAYPSPLRYGARHKALSYALVMHVHAPSLLAPDCRPFIRI